MFPQHRATYLAPVGIGLTLFTLHLLMVAWTGCSVNPARSLGPAAVSANFSAYHWIYWAAPLCDGILSVIYFQLLKALNYNSVVLDQDADHEVSGLRPVYMRVYKRLAGHGDWKQTPRRPRRRALWVMRRNKVVRQDGTTAYVETPVVVDVERAHPHDEVIEGPQLVSPAQIGTSETLVESDGRLPLPVTARTSDDKDVRV